MKQFLENTPLKGFIPEEYHNQIKVTTYKLGEYLHHHENPMEFIHFILSGRVQFNSMNKEGKQLNYAFIDSFSGLGLHELLFDRAEKSDLVAAADNTEILSIPMDIAKELLNNDKFKIFVLELFASRLYYITNRLINLHFSGIENHLLYLLSASENNEIKFKNMRVFSEMLGINRRSLFRAVKDLEEKGKIKRSENKLFLLEESNPEVQK